MRICIGCQIKSHNNSKQHGTATLPFFKLSIFLHLSIPMGTQSPINPAFEKHLQINPNIDDFNKYVVKKPTPRTSAHYALNSSFHDWFSNFGPHYYLIVDKGNEYFNTEMKTGARCLKIDILQERCMLLRELNLLKWKTKNTCTHLRLFLHHTPENW